MRTVILVFTKPGLQVRLGFRALCAIHPLCARAAVWCCAAFANSLTRCCRCRTDHRALRSSMATMTASPAPAGSMWAASVPVDVMAEALSVAAGARPMASNSPLVSPELLDALVAAAEQQQRRQRQNHQQTASTAAAANSAAPVPADGMACTAATASSSSRSAGVASWPLQVKTSLQGPPFTVDVQVGSPSSSTASISPTSSSSMSSADEDQEVASPSSCHHQQQQHLELAAEEVAAQQAAADAAAKRMAKRKKRVSWGPDVILYDPAAIAREQTLSNRLRRWWGARSSSEVAATAVVVGSVAAAAATAGLCAGRLYLCST